MGTIKKNVSLVLILVFLLLLFIALRVSASISSETLTVDSDAYVNDTDSEQNFNALGVYVGMKDSYTFQGWYIFNLSRPSGKYVLNASFWAYIFEPATQSNEYQYAISEANEATYDETTITWKNKPDYGDLLDAEILNVSGWHNWTIASSYSQAFEAQLEKVGYVLYAPFTPYILLEDREDSLGTGNTPYLNLTTMTPETYSISPVNAVSIYNSTVNFVYNTTDTGGLINCSLILDGVLNVSNITLTGNTTSNFTVSDIDLGLHNWSILCYDIGRDVYQMSSESRNFTIAALVEWYDPDSDTTLELGEGVLSFDDPVGTRTVYSNSTNTNVVVSCQSGDCATITTNWSSISMISAQELLAYFNCSTDAVGSYEAQFSLSSDEDSVLDILTVNCSILASDLRINSTNITFNQSTPFDGESVMVLAGIYNDGDYNATNATVRFYEGSYLLGDQVGDDQNITLEPGESTVVNITWSAKIGSYDLYVVVDPDVAVNGEIEESNESNNVAYNTLVVTSWTVFVGNVSGNILLRTVDNRTVIKWAVSDTSESIVYVTDADNTVDFNSLIAFSRDTVGDFSATDFEEFDTLINTTLFSDSINATFTSGGVPTNTQTWDIYGRSVENIPVINSTNSSIFLTGILWDSSDDEGNGHYDNTTNEDVVFIAKVNQSQNGKYGFYDYELKIPARLALQDQTGTTNLMFYSEII